MNAFDTCRHARKAHFLHLPVILGTSENTLNICISNLIYTTFIYQLYLNKPGGENQLGTVLNQSCKIWDLFSTMLLGSCDTVLKLHIHL